MEPSKSLTPRIAYTCDSPTTRKTASNRRVSIVTSTVGDNADTSQVFLRDTNMASHHVMSSRLSRQACFERSSNDRSESAKDSHSTTKDSYARTETSGARGSRDYSLQACKLTCGNRTQLSTCTEFPNSSECTCLLTLVRLSYRLIRVQLLTLATRDKISGVQLSYWLISLYHLTRER